MLFFIHLNLDENKINAITGCFEVHFALFSVSIKLPSLPDLTFFHRAILPITCVKRELTNRRVGTRGR